MVKIKRKGLCIRFKFVLGLMTNKGFESVEEIEWGTR